MYLETTCKITNSCPCGCFVENNAKTSQFYQTLLYLGYSGLPAHVTNMATVMSSLSDFLISLKYVFGHTHFQQL